MQSFQVAAARLLTSLLRYEVDQNFTREQGMLLGGDEAKRVIAIGQPLAEIGATYSAALGTVAATGNGVLTLDDPATGPGVKPGTYRLTCVAEEEDGGAFLIQDPDGVSIGVLPVGGSFDGEIRIASLTDGATDWALGDSIDIVVIKTAEGKLVAFDPAGDDGSQVLHGVALANVVAPDGIDVGLLYLARGPAILADAGLVWPDGISAGAKAAAVAALEAKGILIRGV